MQPLVSVIIPCYNSAATIERAIRSVLAQKHDNLEIIVIDDASGDYELTRKKLEAFNDQRIRLMRHETNRNGSAARNTGIRSSKGMYIALLDSDDEWLPEHVEASLRKCVPEGTDRFVVYCQNIVKTSGHSDLVIPASGIKENEKLSDYLFCNKGYMSTPSLFAPAAVFRENEFDESLIRHQDYELLLRMEARKIRFLFSEHKGVVVHWENNDMEKKGGTWEYSLGFAQKNKNLFTPKAFSCFIFKNVILSLFSKKERLKGLRIFAQNCNPFLLGFKDWAFFVDYLIFGKLSIVKLYRVKNENNQ